MQRKQFYWVEPCAYWKPWAAGPKNSRSCRHSLLGHLRGWIINSALQNRNYLGGGGGWLSETKLIWRNALYYPFRAHLWRWHFAVASAGTCHSAGGSWTDLCRHWLLLYCKRGLHIRRFCMYPNPDRNFVFNWV